MLLTVYDFHDIYRALILVRAYPDDQNNGKVAASILQTIEEAQEDPSVVDDNLIRRRLSAIDFDDNERWQWVFVRNNYSYGVRVMERGCPYEVMRIVLRELLDAIRSECKDRIIDCADAAHNLPIIFTEQRKNERKKVLLEVSHYSRLWNNIKAPIRQAMKK